MRVASADIENEDSEGKRKREAQRLMVCKEIISTEKSYVYNLTDMIQRFIRPLNANARCVRCCLLQSCSCLAFFVECSGLGSASL